MLESSSKCFLEMVRYSFLNSLAFTFSGQIGMLWILDGHSSDLLQFLLGDSSASIAIWTFIFLFEIFSSSPNIIFFYDSLKFSGNLEIFLHFFLKLCNRWYWKLCAIMVKALDIPRNKTGLISISIQFKIIQ